MNRRNWLSALLAVIMVISMLTCIILPAAAEDDMTLPADAVSVQEVATASGTNFYVETVADLIFVANNYASFATGDVIYLIDDLDISAYDGDFAADFVGIGLSHDKYLLADFNGLGHTIFNYTDTHEFFEGMGGNVKNVTFSGGTVTLATYGGFVSGYCGTRASGTVAFTNVHVYDATLVVNGNFSAGFITGATNNKSGRHISMTNCSVVGCTLDGAASTTNASGLVMGRYRDSAGATVTMTNIVLADSTLIANGATNEGGGLVIGDLAFRTTGKTPVTINGLAVINCKHQNLSTSNSGIITAGSKYYGAIAASNVFAVGNMRSTDEGASWSAMTNLIQIPNGGNHSGTTVTNYKTDAGVTYAINSADADVTSVENANATEGFGVGSALALLNADYDYVWTIVDGEVVPAAEGDTVPYTITFKHPDGDMVFYTNPETGTIEISEGNKEIIDEQTWADGAIDWDATYDADYTYKLGIVVTYTYNGDGTHKVTCSEGDCEHAADAVECTPVEHPEFDVALSYYNKAKTGYICELCEGNVSVETDDAVPAPFSVKLDKEVYFAGDTVVLTIDVAEDAGIDTYDIEVATTGKVDATVESGLTGDTTIELTVTDDVVAADTLTVTISSVMDAEGNDLVPLTPVVTAEAVFAVPVTDAESCADATAFTISTVEDLVWAAENADLFTSGDVLYLVNDLDIYDYSGDFATDFVGFKIGAEFKASIDGQNHTIAHYEDTQPLIGELSGTAKVSNLIFENAAVSGTSLVAVVAQRVRGGANAVIENVHVRNSVVESSSAGGAYSAAFVGQMQGATTARALSINNSSIVNTTVANTYFADNDLYDAPDTMVYGIGLAVGRVDKQCTINITNVVAINSTVSGSYQYGNNNGGGLLIGDLKASGDKAYGNFTNVGVFDCNFVGYAKGTDNFAIITSPGKVAGANVVAKNIYASGNMRAAEAGSMEATVAIDNLFAISGNATATVSVSDHLTDAGVKYTVEDGSSSKTNANTVKVLGVEAALAKMNANTEFDWTIEDGAIVPASETPEIYTATFVFEDGSKILLGTDPATGVIVADEETKALTDSACEWDPEIVWGTVLADNVEYVAVAHTVVVDEAVTPTCTETGLTEGSHCENCGVVIVAQEEVAALGHTEVVDEAVAPTCTETGLTEGKHCEVCGEVLVAQEVVDALGHTEEVVAGYAATCTETGLTDGKVCSCSAV